MRRNPYLAGLVLLVLAVALVGGVRPGTGAVAGDDPWPEGIAPQWYRAPVHAIVYERMLADTSSAGHDGKHGWWRTYESPHFTYRVLVGSLAERDIPQIIATHESAYTDIVARLGTAETRKIAVFVYPSQRVGKTLAGEFSENMGGFAQPDKLRIHEIYNKYYRTPPGHEQTHVLSFALLGRMNRSPLLNEGLARFLDHSGADWLQVSAGYRMDGHFVPIEGLLDEFPAAERKAAYAEAGAFVGFLINRYGMDRFRQLWASEAETTSFQDIYGLSLAQLSGEWLALVDARARP